MVGPLRGGRGLKPLKTEKLTGQYRSTEKCLKYFFSTFLKILILKFKFVKKKSAFLSILDDFQAKK